MKMFFNFRCKLVEIVNEIHVKIGVHLLSKSFGFGLKGNWNQYVGEVNKLASISLQHSVPELSVSLTLRHRVVIETNQERCRFFLTDSKTIYPVIR